MKAVSRVPLTLASLRNGTLTVRAVLDQVINAIAVHNGHCNALVARLTPEELRAAADAADLRYQSGTARPLEGIPIAIKDNLATIDFTTSCASNVLKGYKSPIDATAVRHLREAGAIIIGKTNMDEFGMGSFNANSAYGPCLQPGTEFVAGGSSGGSAVAVQSGMALAALGTDTGGSVRLPASYCGVVSMKPTYGAISRWGLIPYAHSLDTVGIFAKTVADVEFLYGLIAKADAQDMTCTGDQGLGIWDKSDADFDATSASPDANQGEAPSAPSSPSRALAIPPSPSSTRTSSPAPRRFKVGIPEDYNLTELTDEARAQWSRGIEACEALGMEVVSIRLPHTLHALAAYYVLAPAEASSNLAKYDGVRYGEHRRFLEKEVQRRVLIGAYALSASSKSYYLEAQQIRRLVVQDFDKAFEKVDVLLCPAALSGAPAYSAISELPPTSAYVNDVFTIPASMAGLPTCVVPGSLSTPATNGSDSDLSCASSLETPPPSSRSPSPTAVASNDGCGRSLGLQVQGPRGHERDVFAVSRLLFEALEMRSMSAVQQQKMTEA